MSFDTLKNALPDYAKDLKLNLSSLENSTVLSPEEHWGTLLACAIAARNAEVMKVIAPLAQNHLSPEAYNAAAGAAAIMGMNNVYYRFLHLCSDKTYGTMPAGLRMNIIGNPGVDKKSFELWSLAVSAINACGLCIDSHEKKLRSEGVTAESIQAAVKIASVIQAVAVILEAVPLVSR